MTPCVQTPLASQNPSRKTQCYFTMAPDMLCALGPVVHPDLTSYLDRPLARSLHMPGLHLPQGLCTYCPSRLDALLRSFLSSTSQPKHHLWRGFSQLPKVLLDPRWLSGVFPSQGGRSVPEFLSLVSRLTSSPDMEGVLREERNLIWLSHRSCQGM